MSVSWTEGATDVVKSGVSPARPAITDGHDQFSGQPWYASSRPAAHRRHPSESFPPLHSSARRHHAGGEGCSWWNRRLSQSAGGGIPECRFSDGADQHLAARCQPGNHGLNVAALQTPVLADSGHKPMTCGDSLGSTSITLQFELSAKSSPPISSRSKPAINASQRAIAQQSAGPADHPPGQSPMRQSPVLSLSSVLCHWTRWIITPTVISQQVSRIDGVGLVTIGGQQKPAVRIRTARPLQDRSARVADRQCPRPDRRGNHHRAQRSIVGPERGLTAVHANTTRSWTRRPGMIWWQGYDNGAPVRTGGYWRCGVPSVENNQIGAWVFLTWTRPITDPSLKGRPKTRILLAIFRQPGAVVIDHGEPNTRRAARSAGQHP